jgi:hypothetical protein
MNTVGDEAELIDPTNYKWDALAFMKFNLLRMYLVERKHEILENDGIKRNGRKILGRIEVKRPFDGNAVDDNDSGVCVIHWLYTLMNEGEVNYEVPNINHLRGYYSKVLHSRLEIKN